MDNTKFFGCSNTESVYSLMCHRALGYLSWIILPEIKQNTNQLLSRVHKNYANLRNNALSNFFCKNSIAKKHSLWQISYLIEY